MKEVTFEEVFKIEQLMFPILLHHIPQIVKDKSDARIVRSLNDELDKFWKSYAKSYPDGRLILEEDLIREKNGDNKKGFFNANYDVLRRFPNVIDIDKLILTLAINALNALEALEKSDKSIVFYYDTYNFKNDTKISDEETNHLKQRLAEGILKAKSLLRGKRGKVDSISVNATINTGEIEITKKLTKKSLERIGKSGLVLSNLNYDNINDYIKDGLIQKHELIDAIKKGIISRENAIHILSKGCEYSQDILKEVFKVSTFEELLSSDNLTTIDRIQLYSAGIIQIADLERYMGNNPNTIMPEEESYKQIAKYYKGNIKRLSELLTHNVLDYISSIAFLDYLLELGYISEKEKEDLIKLMSDFKVNQLDAKEPTGQSIIINTGMSSTHSSRLTIEPQFRADYLISIGQVKQILVNGSGFIKDDTENSTQNSDEKTKGKKQKNSLDGYQLIIVPEKGVAILEKFYEVTRDKEGNIVYKKDKEGKVIPAIENATYIIPIGMAKEFVETKNKQQLIKNPFVARVPHTGNWVVSVEKGIRTVCERVGMTVSFDKENTDIWNQKIKENYEQHRDR